MNFFHVYAENRTENRTGRKRAPRTWFVIAGSLLEAMSLIPEDFTVTAVEVQVETAPGPGRVVGSQPMATGAAVSLPRLGGASLGVVYDK